METKTLPNIYFLIDTCAKVAELMRSFEAATDLFIAAGNKENGPNWERKARITNVLTYQIFRELAGTAEPGMGILTHEGQNLLRRPEFNLTVETAVCRRFLSRLQEKCIKPYIIDPILAGNDELCEKLRVEAERLRAVTKGGNTHGMRPIKLFDKGFIRDAYVVQALRSPLLENGRPLWDNIKDTPELKFARKDAGEFSILPALTHSRLDKPYSIVIVTKDEGALDLIKAAYHGKDKVEKYCDKIIETRKTTPRAKALIETHNDDSEYNIDKDILPYNLPNMVKKPSKLPEAHILSERGLADLLLGIQFAADRFFSKGEHGDKRN
jgi:hypothetical protein